MGAPALAPRRAPSQRPARRAPSKRTPAKRSTAKRSTASRPKASAAAGRPKPRLQRQGVAQPALAGAALIPHAAARTAGAVRDLSDSSLIVRLTSGRGWIAVLCALLGGIVALNVVSLSINATSGRVSQAIEEYERHNSALRAQLAEELSASRVEDAASSMGLAVPAPESVTYVDAGDRDLEQLADALGGGNLMSYDSPTTTSSGYDEASGYAPAADTVTTAPGSTPPASAPAAAPPTAAPAAPVAPAPPSGEGAPTGGVGL